MSSCRSEQKCNKFVVNLRWDPGTKNRYINCGKLRNFDRDFYLQNEGLDRYKDTVNFGTFCCCLRKCSVLRVEVFVGNFVTHMIFWLIAITLHYWMRLLWFRVKMGLSSISIDERGIVGEWVLLNYSLWNTGNKLYYILLIC